jgi:hypothetical protein
MIMTKIPNDLIEKVKHGDCVPIIGAGFSKSLNYPLWSELIDEIKDRIIRDFPSINRASLNKLNDLQVPKYLLDLHIDNKNPLYDLIDDLFSKATGLHDEKHKILAELPIDSIITTNWDESIENAMEYLGQKHKVIYKTTDAKEWNERKGKYIIKMHGTIQDKESLVFNHDDYLSYPLTKELIEDTVKTLLRARSPLIMGFSLNDPNFDRLLYHIKYHLRDRTPLAYAIFIDGSECLLDYWYRQGIRVISLKTRGDQTKSDVLLNVLNELLVKVRTIANDKYERAELQLREMKQNLSEASSGYEVKLRASLGPLASPKQNEEFRIFSNESDISERAFKLDEDEWKINRTCKEYLKKGATIKCILSYSPEHLCEKYTPRQGLERLKTLKSYLNSRGNIRVVFTNRELKDNVLIFKKTALESKKIDTDDSRLYDYAEVITEQDKISKLNKVFDRQYDQIKRDNLIEASNIGISGSSEDIILKRFAKRKVQRYIQEVSTFLDVSEE